MRVDNQTKTSKQTDNIAWIHFAKGLIVGGNKLVSTWWGCRGWYGEREFGGMNDNLIEILNHPRG